MIDNWLIEEVYVSTPRYSLFVFVLNDISNTISNIKQFACRNIVYAVVRTIFRIKIHFSVLAIHTLYVRIRICIIFWMTATVISYINVTFIK